MTSNTPRRVLLVDDEPNVLDGLVRQLRRGFEVSVANGPRAALSSFDSEDAFPVVVSDYMMPEMNGIALLSAIRQTSPRCIMLMLTGNADLAVAAEAVNRGLLFRFLTKPCSPDALIRALDEAFEQIRLRDAERDLLEKTVRGVVQVLADVLALQSPAAFGRALRVRESVSKVADALGLNDRWRVETAALLSQLGCVSLPHDVVEKAANGVALTPEEAALHRKHPRIAHDLLAHVPRLDEAAGIIAEAAELIETRKAAPLETRLLAAALDYDSKLHLAGSSHAAAIESLRKHRTEFGPDVVDAFEHAVVPTQHSVVAQVGVKQLRVGMTLDQDLTLVSGVKVLSAGHVLTPTVLQRLYAYAELKQLTGTLRVLTQATANPTPV